MRDKRLRIVKCPGWVLGWETLQSLWRSSLKAAASSDSLWARTSSCVKRLSQDNLQLSTPSSRTEETTGAWLSRLARSFCLQTSGVGYPRRLGLRQPWGMFHTFQSTNAKKSKSRSVLSDSWEFFRPEEYWSG